MTIEQRLERIESQNRRLKWVLTAIVGIAVIGCVVGLKDEGDDSMISERAVAAPVVVQSGREVPDKEHLLAGAAPTVVQAGRFEVVDSNGKVVAVMGMNGLRTGGVVFTNNQHGALVAQMGAADDERGVVWTYDRNGAPRESIR
jgi:hypothetical protein